MLDLRADGIALTSVEQGTRFALVGGKPLHTAWIQGADDALLVLDADGDGQIRGGVELFGEGSGPAGRAPDGFAALALLDRAASGGNENGMVDAGDQMFGQLQLWHDRNRDAKSEPAELQSLAEQRIVGLELEPDRSSRIYDRHGNDLSARACFIREDGSRAPLVDVYLSTRARR